MAIEDILKYPGSDMLKRKAKKVETIDRRVLSVLDDMTETLKHAGGNGLAAPQIGVSLRLVVVKNETEYIKLINPLLVKSAGIQYSAEGCLSLPGISCIVKRPDYAVVEALGVNGKPVEIKGQRNLAAALSHELDHLDGILMTDKAIRVMSY